ncbi:hypothetical protein JKF63_00831 [Porcisia hertigi]|uniref:Uncharacterized protein n=1 Tax=Porcisia hertigi TaxID=2761500 RepID=A0A836HDS9_9TRYP|nr:hypothetical protein JKF63_00831 [Porcisia hertigi]
MCLRVKTHPVCPTAAAAARHPSVLLILVTGIPASGKSTFLAAAQHYVLQPDGTLGTVPLFGGRSRGRIHSVLQLDEVLEDLSAAATQTTDPATSAGKRKFNPLLWKRATRRLLELTQSTLHACIEETAGCDETAHVVVPIVFVEDNMHYRSMRERYYQLCRTLEGKAYSLPSLHDASITAAQSQQPFIPLFELRFSTPLDVCLARNAQRDQSWDASNGEKANAPAWVPPPVICSMDALFDHCCVATGVVDHGARNACEVEGWQWTATTQPWGLVVHATRGVTLDKNCPGTLAETAAGFFEVALQQPEAWDECQRQYQDVLRARLLRLREDEPLNENACLLRTAKAVETPHTHKLDLQLRSVVHAFLCQQTHQNACDNDDESSTRQRTAVFRKSLAAAKREAAQRFKVQIRQLSTTGNNVMDNAAVDVLSRSIDDIQESVIQQFQQTVLGLWEELEGCVSSLPHTQ